MSTYSKHLRPTGNSFGLKAVLDSVLPHFLPQRGSMFSLLILMALIAFEVFNYSTTEFALADLIGDLKFSGIRWATILALAFCGMDFAGIARLFSPEKMKREAMESWYLLGAWLLAATMNAILTWWAVSAALLNHEGLGNEIVDRETLLSFVPVFVSLLVWLIRVLMIGSFTLAGSKWTDSKKGTPHKIQNHQIQHEFNKGKVAAGKYPSNGRNFKPAPKPSTHHTEV